MEERIATELELLRKYYPMLIFNPEGNWIKIPDYRMPAGVSWNKTSIDVCFQIIAGYPATPPYGIYVPSDLKCGGEEPLNFQRVANNKPRFDGEWGMLSWTPENGKWKPTADLLKGTNLFNFVKSFEERFKMGK